MSVPANHIPESGPDILRLPARNREHRIVVVKQVKQVVDKKLKYLLDGLSVNVADALFEEMLHLDESDALSRHFNIMRAIRTENHTFREEFLSLMNLSWAYLVNVKDRQPLPDAPAELVPDIKRFNDRNVNHYKVLLEEIRCRFSELVQADLAFHPLLPGNFYLSFWFATARMSLSYEERRLLLPLFHRFVMDRFGQVLSVASLVLEDLLIEPCEAGTYQPLP
ncbi:MAG: hypothetical protein KDI36_20160 [Pseudomonadales bacterium]|nr:hypothetical protein [Pseudomonadales bacterium]